MAKKKTTRKKTKRKAVPPPRVPKATKGNTKPKGATELCNDDDLAEYIFSQLVFRRRDFQLRPMIRDWVSVHHPARNPPGRQTIDKCIKQARDKWQRSLETVVEYDMEVEARKSIETYLTIIENPTTKMRDLMYARERLDELMGIGAKWHTTLASPEQAAARARDFLQKAQESRKEAG